MQQGDQYAVRISIEKDGQALTPDDVAGVKIDLGSLERRYPGELSFDTDSGMWLFPVSQVETLALSGRIPAQVQVNLGGNPAQIIGSKVSNVIVDASLIRSVWDD